MQANEIADSFGIRAYPVRQVPLDAPWAWLAKGWRDLLRVPQVSLLYGLVAVAVAALILWGLTKFGAQSLMIVFSAGFLLVSPMLAVGLYEVSRRLVRDTERIFAFWTYLAAYAPAAEIRTAAEALAEEELDRVARLRGERRRAYGAERASAGGRERPVASAETLERHLAEGLDRLAAELPPAEAARARELAGEARGMADEASSLEGASLPVAGSGEAADRANSLLAAAERLVERYLDAAEAAREEAAVARAQSLARRAIARLAWLGTAPTPG